MFVSLLVMALAATEPGMVCRSKTVTSCHLDDHCVCPAVKPKAKKIVKRHPVVLVPATPVQAQKQAEAQKQQQSQNQQVIVQIIASEPRIYTEPRKEEVEAASPWGIGVLGAVGLFSCDPHVFADVGIRARFPLHLGLEVNTQFYWGHSAQLLIYPIQGPISWHLDVGGHWFYHYAFSAQDVPRKWDMLFGTGLEFNVLPHLSIIADWRVTMPNPGTFGRYSNPDERGVYLNPGNVVANSFARSQLMLGLMLHTW